MEWLKTAAVLLGMFLSAGSILIIVGKLIQRLSSHEELDKERFNSLRGVCEDIREDVRELRSRP